MHPIPKTKWNKFELCTKQESQAYRGIQAIQMLSNWLYWESPRTDAAPLVPTQRWNAAYRRSYDGASIKKLKAAAAARKRAPTTTAPPGNTATDYWEPLAISLPTTTPDPASKPQPKAKPIPRPNIDDVVQRPVRGSSSPLRWGIPMGASIVAATVVRLQLGDAAGGALEDHVGGSLGLAVVNSSWMQLALAALPWYLVFTCIVELVETALRRK